MSDLRTLQRLINQIESQGTTGLLDELLWLLDELREIHALLDKLDILAIEPTTHIPFSLKGRIEMAFEHLQKKEDELETLIEGIYDIEAFSEEVDEKYQEIQFRTERERPEFPTFIDAQGNEHAEF
jgi:hypothetical protein